MSENEFGFDVEYVKPLIEISFIRDKSGKDLTFHKQMFKLKCTKSHYKLERYTNQKLE